MACPETIFKSLFSVIFNKLSFTVDRYKLLLIVYAILFLSGLISLLAALRGEIINKLFPLFL